MFCPGLHCPVPDPVHQHHSRNEITHIFRRLSRTTLSSTWPSTSTSFSQWNHTHIPVAFPGLHCPVRIPDLVVSRTTLSTSTPFSQWDHTSLARFQDYIVQFTWPSTSTSFSQWNHTHIPAAFPGLHCPVYLTQYFDIILSQWNHTHNSCRVSRTIPEPLPRHHSRNEITYSCRLSSTTLSSIPDPVHRHHSLAMKSHT